LKRGIGFSKQGKTMACQGKGKQLKSVLEITDVNFVRGKQALGVVDSTLE
jgi:hypothetical protein